jgi:DNA-binding response OmpR family regulator
MKSPKGQWILLVDDDTVFNGLLSDLLTLSGYSTLQAFSYAEASEALKHGDPALAIVDYKLPDLDGVTWITTVRNSGKNFPIIFVSITWLDINLFNRLRNVLHVPLILQKPIDPKLFMDQIQDLLPKAAGAVEMLEAVGDHYEPGKVDSSVYNLPLRHSDAVAGALAKAKNAFSLELPERVRRLAELIHNAKENGCRKDLVVEAMDEAHKLKGSTSSFGYDGLASMSSTIEHLLKNLEPDAGSMLDLMWSEIFRYLSDSEAVANDAAADAGGGAPVTASGAGKRVALVVADETLCREIADGMSADFVGIVSVPDLKSGLDYADNHQIHALAIDVSSCDVNKAKELVGKCRNRTGFELVPGLRNYFSSALQRFWRSRSAPKLSKRR